MIIALICIVVVLAFVMTIYNNGISKRNYVKEAFSTMDVYLKKRWDLIPNLVETTKGYMEYEKQTLEKITELRNKTYSALDNNEKMQINNELSLGLSKLIAVSENYPDLKANQTFMELMQNLKVVEEDIANARKYYNGCAREYNTYIELFPNCIFASMFGFKKENMFEINEDERENVKVSFN